MKNSIEKKAVAPMSTFNPERTPINMANTRKLKGVKILGTIELPAKKEKKVAPVAPVKIFDLGEMLSKTKKIKVAKNTLIAYWSLLLSQKVNPTEICAKMENDWGYYPQTGLIKISFKMVAIGTPFAHLV